MSPKALRYTINNCNLFVVAYNDSGTPIAYLCASRPKIPDDSFVDRILETMNQKERTKLFLTPHGDREFEYSYIRLIVVKTRYRKKRVGTQLFEAFQRECKDEYQLWMVDDVKNVGFYRKIGAFPIVATNSVELGDPGKREPRILVAHSNDLKKWLKLQKEQAYL
jgi:GNAT superfamily N-acetyltransferase